MPKFFQHKFKCMVCGLHFIVCSDYEDWPNTGTTRDLAVGEATGLVHCPECGSNGPKLHWIQEVEDFIFNSVPGGASMKFPTY